MGNTSIAALKSPVIQRLSCKQLSFQSLGHVAGSDLHSEKGSSLRHFSYKHLITRNTVKCPHETSDAIAQSTSRSCFNQKMSRMSYISKPDPWGRPSSNSRHNPEENFEWMGTSDGIVSSTLRLRANQGQGPNILRAQVTQGM